MGDLGVQKGESFAGLVGERLMDSPPQNRCRSALEGYEKKNELNELFDGGGGGARSMFGTPSYPSPLDRIRTGKKDRAVQLGLERVQRKSFETNQSFPKTSRPKFWHDTEPTPDLKKTLDDFKGDGLKDVSFTSNQPPRGSFGSMGGESKRNLSLRDSFGLYNYVSSGQSASNFPASVRNPSKAIMTIDARTSEILVANDIACDLFGFSREDMIGFHLSCLLNRKSKEPLAFMETHLEGSGEILELCGQVLTAVDATALEFPVSVWVQKLDTEEPRALVVVEPVNRTTATVTFDSTGAVLDCDDQLPVLHGYPNATEMMGENITSLIPSLVLPTAGSALHKDIKKQRATGRTKEGVSFPLNISISYAKTFSQPGNRSDGEEDNDEDDIEIYTGIIWVFANISGMITILPGGKIHGINPNFALMLLGYSQLELIGKDISFIIPSFYEDVSEADCEFPMPVMAESMNLSATEESEEDDASFSDLSNTDDPEVTDEQEYDALGETFDTTASTKSTDHEQSGASVDTSLDVSLQSYLTHGKDAGHSLSKSTRSEYDNVGDDECESERTNEITSEEDKIRDSGVTENSEFEIISFGEKGADSHYSVQNGCEIAKKPATGVADVEVFDMENELKRMTLRSKSLDNLPVCYSFCVGDEDRLSYSASRNRASDSADVKDFFGMADEREEMLVSAGGQNQALDTTVELLANTSLMSSVSATTDDLLEAQVEVLDGESSDEHPSEDDRRLDSSAPKTNWTPDVVVVHSSSENDDLSPGVVPSDTCYGNTEQSHKIVKKDTPISNEQRPSSGTKDKKKTNDFESCNTPSIDESPSEGGVWTQVTSTPKDDDHITVDSNHMDKDAETKQTVHGDVNKELANSVNKSSQHMNWCTTSTPKRDFPVSGEQVSSRRKGDVSKGLYKNLLIRRESQRLLSCGEGNTCVIGNEVNAISKDNSTPELSPGVVSHSKCEKSSSNILDKSTQSVYIENSELEKSIGSFKDIENSNAQVPCVISFPKSLELEPDDIPVQRDFSEDSATDQLPEPYSRQEQHVDSNDVDTEMRMLEEMTASLKLDHTSTPSGRRSSQRSGRSSGHVRSSLSRSICRDSSFHRSTAPQPWIPEGAFTSKAKHRDGTCIDITYHVKKVELDNGQQVYCLWVYREVDSQVDNRRSRFNMTLASSISSAHGKSFDTSTGADISLGEQLIHRARDQKKEPPPAEAPSTNDSISKKSPHDSTGKRNPYEGQYEQEYETVSQIGKGAFGFVSSARKRCGGENEVVVKFIRKDKVLKGCMVQDSALGSIPLEVSLLRKLSHPNIVNILNVYQNDHYVQLVMEKHGMGMDLFEFIDRHPNLDEALASYIFRQMISAISYLHRQNILHRDIKDENIILDQRFQIKLIDFGSAAYMEPGKLFATFCGTLEYCSPEVLKGNKYRGPELEMWSIGVTLYTLVFVENPFFDADEIMKCILRPPFQVSEDLMEVIAWLLHPKPELRATISDMEMDPWVQQPICIDTYEWDMVLPNSEFYGNTASDNRLDTSEEENVKKPSQCFSLSNIEEDFYMVMEGESYRDDTVAIDRFPTSATVNKYKSPFDIAKQRVLEEYPDLKLPALNLALMAQNTKI